MGKVIVTGSINMDIVATTARRPQPGETVLGTKLRFFPGGKGANQAVAAARAGAETEFVGNVGDDSFSFALTAFLEDAGVDPSAVHRVKDTPTGVALIVVDAEGENAIVVVPGANGTLTPEDVGRVSVAAGDVVVAQLEIPIETVVAALARAKTRGATTVLNPAPAQRLSHELNDLVDVLVLNEVELGTIASAAITSTTDVTGLRSAVATLDHRADQVTVVTLGARGAIAFAGERVIEVAARRVEVVDSIGAGDCFVGVLAARLAAGDPLEAALTLANTAASICVERPGAGLSMPTLAEVRARGDAAER